MRTGQSLVGIKKFFGNYNIVIRVAAGRGDNECMWRCAQSEIVAIELNAAGTTMSEAEVAARLPGILARLNPRGGRGGIAPARRLEDDWTRAINDATTIRNSRARRKLAAERAVGLAGLARADERLALSYYWLGRLSLSTDPERALDAFQAAGQIYGRRSDTAIQGAHVALQMAAFQLSAGRADLAIRLVDQHLAVTRRTEHAALLSLLMLVKAEALDLKGNTRESARVEREALAWARYGFGSDAEVRDRAAEIFAISPRARATGGSV